MAPTLLAYAELRFLGTGQADEAAESLLPLLEGRMTRPLDPTLLETVIALIDGLEHAGVHLLTDRRFSA